MTSRNPQHRPIMKAMAVIAVAMVALFVVLIVVFGVELSR